MKNLSLKMKVLSGMLCAGLTFSGSNISFAAVNQGSNNESKFVANVKESNPRHMKEIEDSIRLNKRVDALDDLIKEMVDSKEITRDEGDKILKYVAEKINKECKDGEKCKSKTRDHKKGGLFGELVTEGILTKEKSEMLRTKMYSKGEKIKNEEIQRGLTTLVDNKLLTIEQRDKVEAAIIANDAQRKEEFKKMKTMNEKEKQEHIKKMRDTQIDPMKALVDAGTITKEQMNQIKNIMLHH